MKKPELLSPVGNMDCLYAAIEAGCDAVYLGGRIFGARSFAGNFSNDELIEAIKYAHLYGVKVYVTVNTLIFDEEVQEFMDYIDFIHRNNVDAIIIQDLGMLDLVRKVYPNLEIHASTQMNIHNLEGVEFAKEMGIKRVVLARETEFKSLKDIKKMSGIELEVFVHGALCMCYSGECLMSRMLTGRSGNRGTCSQPCRMKYDLFDEEGKKQNKDSYLLSTKDLSTIYEIGNLIDIGIDSLKIEGRMKSPEYVYVITNLYRRAIDNYIKYKDVKITENDILEAEKIFNRGFTKGFMFYESNNNFTNEYRPNHMGINIGKVIDVNYKIKIKLSSELYKGDGIRFINNYDDGGIVNKIYKNGKVVDLALTNEIVELDNMYKVNVGDVVLKTKDIRQIDNINIIIKNRNRKVNITGYIECLIDKPLKLVLMDDKNKVEVLGEKVSPATKIHMTNSDINKQIAKLGDTVYDLKNLEIKRDENIFVRVSSLNELRRQAIEKLNSNRQYNIKYIKNDYDISLEDNDEPNGFSYSVNDIDKYKQITNYKYLYTDNQELLKLDKNIIYKLPRIIPNNVIKGNFLCGEIGSLYVNKSYADFSLNVTNSYTVAFLHSIGIKRITLSHELSLEQIRELINNYKKRYNKKPNLEMVVSSYPEIMVTKYNLLKKYNIDSGYLKDIKNREFKIIGKNGLMYIKNYQKLEYDYDKCFEIGVKTLRIEID